jgi:hypothetical protein
MTVALLEKTPPKPCTSACGALSTPDDRRMRRGEIGHHHHIAGAYLLRYAQEASWREDYRRTSNGDQVRRLSGLAVNHKPPVDFCGY